MSSAFPGISAEQVEKVIGAVESFEWTARQTGIPSSKLRTWYARNTNGFRDLFVRHDHRPPFLLTVDPDVQEWIAKHKQQ